MWNRTERNYLHNSSMITLLHTGHFPMKPNQNLFKIIQIIAVLRGTYQILNLILLCMFSTHSTKLFPFYVFKSNACSYTASIFSIQPFSIYKDNHITYFYQF